MLMMCVSIIRQGDRINIKEFVGGRFPCRDYTYYTRIWWLNNRLCQMNTLWI